MRSNGPQKQVNYQMRLEMKKNNGVGEMTHIMQDRRPSKVECMSTTMKVVRTTR